MQPQPLDTHVNWRAADVADPEAWTVRLTQQDHDELDAALRHARRKSRNLMEIGRDDFPLEGLARKIGGIERELIAGRGFVRISALDTTRYDDEELTMLYWGIGTHLGHPWPQNKHGHVMGDVTDQGRRIDDPTTRGNELGRIALSWHTDGSDLVGLMCLRPALSGGLSCVANVVAIYNELVATRPDLVAALYDDLPWDFRGEEAPGTQPWYMRPVFTAHAGRLFCRYVPHYIMTSQRHEGAPRLSPLVVEALDTVMEMANRPEFHVAMELAPGEMQFINNYHVLHGRTAYEDDIDNGVKRHLKRLWLSTRTLTDRPRGFEARVHAHWEQNRSVSAIAAL
ncbi:TauD/TfdA family dioxygenase [Novosphingobium sp. KCTC 2891]|uniref:TauD/TfdA family dioxygenase n=1 Tax=Novosphingobium sp. KCTC 2891 TaxID=2989730 RepID=UPI0022225224|nr:TauD/TfdA family dioxygenase [Novosphingobium sp. KCTC 2891]MCW1384416.1 TauD/TfdA family dioxygenase [Novosphingobium sp. KCTC 2891]